TFKHYCKSVFAILIAPHIALNEWQLIETKKKGMVDKADSLALAAIAVGCLRKCYENFRDVLKNVGNALTRIHTELQGLVHNSGAGTDDVTSDDVANVFFEIVKKDAASIVSQCDRFLQTRLTY